MVEYLSEARAAGSVKASLPPTPQQKRPHRNQVHGTVTCAHWGWKAGRASWVKDWGVREGPSSVELEPTVESQVHFPMELLSIMIKFHGSYLIS